MKKENKLSNFSQEFVGGRNPLLDLCPFCGEPAEIFRLEKNEFKVHCGNQSCPFKPCSQASYKTEEMAIKAWNTRKGFGDEPSIRKLF